MEYSGRLKWCSTTAVELNFLAPWSKGMEQNWFMGWIGPEGLALPSPTPCMLDLEPEYPSSWHCPIPSPMNQDWPQGLAPKVPQGFRNLAAWEWCPSQISGPIGSPVNWMMWHYRPDLTHKPGIRHPCSTGFRMFLFRKRCQIGVNSLFSMGIALSDLCRQQRGNVGRCWCSCVWNRIYKIICFGMSCIWCTIMCGKTKPTFMIRYIFFSLWWKLIEVNGQIPIGFKEARVLSLSVPWDFQWLVGTAFILLSFLPFSLFFFILPNGTI